MYVLSYEENQGEYAKNSHEDHMTRDVHSELPRGLLLRLRANSTFSTKVPTLRKRLGCRREMRCLHQKQPDMRSAWALCYSSNQCSSRPSGSRSPASHCQCAHPKSTDTGSRRATCEPASSAICLSAGPVPSCSNAASIRWTVQSIL